MLCLKQLLVCSSSNQSSEEGINDNLSSAGRGKDVVTGGKYYHLGRRRVLRNKTIRSKEKKLYFINHKKRRQIRNVPTEVSAPSAEFLICTFKPIKQPVPSDTSEPSKGVNLNMAINKKKKIIFQNLKMRT